MNQLEVFSANIDQLLKQLNSMTKNSYIVLYNNDLHIHELVKTVWSADIDHETIMYNTEYKIMEFLRYLINFLELERGPQE